MKHPEADLHVATFNNPAQADHVTNWDPRRVLAEYDAKRRIIDE